MSSTNMRHRVTSGKHGVSGADAALAQIFNEDSDGTRGDGASRHHQRVHWSVWVWARIAAIAASFAVLVLWTSNFGTSKIVTPAATSAGGGIRDAGGNASPSFVTVVMPSVVKPEARPLRLINIAKTWGPASRAVYVVHGPDEYAEGEPLNEASKSRPYPQLLLVPEHITSDMGVPRLEHVIRTVLADLNPDFAFFVNDHTFVLPDHLCKFLEGHDSASDMYAGHALKGKGEVAFNSGAAGYILSRKTMERLRQEWDDPRSKCSAASASKWLQGNPGLVTAKCFGEVLRVPVVDTRDPADASHTFHAYGLIRTVTGRVDDWYLNKHDTLDGVLGVDNAYHHRPQPGFKCCSSGTISFHYVEAGESVAFWDVLQRIRRSPDLTDDQIQTLMTEVWPKEREGLGFYAHGLPGIDPAIWKDIVDVVRKISVGVAPPSC